MSRALRIILSLMLALAIPTSGFAASALAPWCDASAAHAARHGERIGPAAHGHQHTHAFARDRSDGSAAPATAGFDDAGIATMAPLASAGPADTGACCTCVLHCHTVGIAADAVTFDATGLPHHYGTAPLASAGDVDDDALERPPRTTRG